VQIYVQKLNLIIVVVVVVVYIYTYIFYFPSKRTSFIDICELSVMFEVTKLSMSSASSKRENYNNLKQPIKYHRRMPKPVNCMRSDISVISAVYWGQSL